MLSCVGFFLHIPRNPKNRYSFAARRTICPTAPASRSQVRAKLETIMRNWAILVTLLFLQTEHSTLAQPQQDAPPFANFSDLADSDLIGAAFPASESAAGLTEPGSPESQVAENSQNDRLAELEKTVAALSKKPSVLTAIEDVTVIIGGQVTADFLYNTARPFAPGTPFFLAPASPTGLSQNTFDAHARQTAVYALFSGPKICEIWEPSAFVYVNLYNDAVVVDRYGLLPIQAYGQVKSASWRIAAGLQFDIFNPLSPTEIGRASCRERVYVLV